MEQKQEMVYDDDWVAQWVNEVSPWFHPFPSSHILPKSLQSIIDLRVGPISCTAHLGSKIDLKDLSVRWKERVIVVKPRYVDFNFPVSNKIIRLTKLPVRITLGGEIRVTNCTSEYVCKAALQAVVTELERLKYSCNLHRFQLKELGLSCRLPFPFVELFRLDHLLDQHNNKKRKYREIEEDPDGVFGREIKMPARFSLRTMKTNSSTNHAKEFFSYHVSDVEFDDWQLRIPNNFCKKHCCSAKFVSDLPTPGAVATQAFPPNHHPIRVDITWEGRVTVKGARSREQALAVLEAGMPLWAQCRPAPTVSK
jgi:hypothetical protein